MRERLPGDEKQKDGPSFYKEGPSFLALCKKRGDQPSWYRAVNFSFR